MSQDKKEIVLLSSRLEILNKYIDFSKDGVMDRGEIIKAMQEYAELYYSAKTKQETFKKGNGCACYGSNSIHKCNCN